MKRIILILLAVVLIGGFFFFNSKNKDKDTVIPGIGKNEKQENGGPFSGTFRDAIALGVPMKCEDTIDTGEGKAKISGIIQGKQYIGQMTAEGKTANVLLKDYCMWSWEEGQQNGIKFCFEESEAEDSFFGDSVELDTSVRCLPTMVTPGMFSPPANVSFLDMDAFNEEALTEEQMRQLEEMSER